MLWVCLILPVSSQIPLFCGIAGVYVPPTTSTTTKTTQTPKPGQSTASGSPNTKKPPATQDQTGGDNSGSTNTAAIVVPIMVILVIGIGAGVGFVLYRRRQNSGNLQMLTGDGATQSSRLTFGRGGVVQFINRIRGQRGDASSMDMGGVSNPCYEPKGTGNPTYDNTAAVFPVDHAECGSDA